MSTANTLDVYSTKCKSPSNVEAAHSYRLSNIQPTGNSMISSRHLGNLSRHFSCYAIHKVIKLLHCKL
ncbi:hypothetical protein ACI0FN_01100 [Alcaligenes nematophilus]